MFGKILSVEREFLGVRTVGGEISFSYRRYGSAGKISPRILEAFENTPRSEDINDIRVFYRRNFLLFGISIRDTLDRQSLPPKEYSFRAFTYRTMRNRILN